MATARYWRFRVVSVDGGRYAAAAEFQLYASADGTTGACTVLDAGGGTKNVLIFDRVMPAAE